METADIKWLPRYSDTNEPDKHGRWSRIAYYKEMQIAWITGIKSPKGEFIYIASTQFPVSGNDMPHDITNYSSFEEAKSGTEKLWSDFIQKLQISQQVGGREIKEAPVKGGVHPKLQKQFNELLASLSREEILEWLEQDRKQQDI